MGSLLNSILLLLLVVNGVVFVSAYVWDQEEDVGILDDHAIQVRIGGDSVDTQSFVAILRVADKVHGICIVYNTKYCLTIKAAVSAFAPSNNTLNRGLTVHLAATGAERTSRRFYLDSGSDLALVQVCPSFPTGSAAVIAGSGTTPAAEVVVSYTTYVSILGENGLLSLTMIGTKTVGEDCECDMHAKMETTAPKNTFCLRASSDIYSYWTPTTSYQEVPGAFVFETSTSKVYGFIITAANSSSVSEVVYDLTTGSRSAFLALSNAP